MSRSVTSTRGVAPATRRPDRALPSLGDEAPSRDQASPSQQAPSLPALGEAAPATQQAPPQQASSQQRR